MALRLYNPAEVLIVFAGVPMAGLGTTTFLSVEPKEDRFTTYIGVDGEGSRGRSTNRSARITLTLLQTAPLNTLLSAFANFDRASASGDGLGPFLVKDLAGQTLISAETAWIAREPTVQFGAVAGEREWILETNRLEALIGGN